MDDDDYPPKPGHHPSMEIFRDRLEALGLDCDPLMERSMEYSVAPSVDDSHDYAESESFRDDQSLRLPGERDNCPEIQVNANDTDVTSHLRAPCALVACPPLSPSSLSLDLGDNVTILGAQPTRELPINLIFHPSSEREQPYVVQDAHDEQDNNEDDAGTVEILLSSSSSCSTIGANNDNSDNYNGSALTLPSRKEATTALLRDLSSRLRRTVSTAFSSASSEADTSKGKHKPQHRMSSVSSPSLSFSSGHLAKLRSRSRLPFSSSTLSLPHDYTAWTQAHQVGTCSNSIVEETTSVDSLLEPDEPYECVSLSWASDTGESTVSVPVASAVAVAASPAAAARSWGEEVEYLLSRVGCSSSPWDC